MTIDSALSPDEISAIAAEAYTYAFPMMMGYRAGYGMYLQPASPVYRGPANSGPYGEAVTLDHHFKDVISPNADTPYSSALLDFRAGPQVLVVPEVNDRYYVMQFEDLYGFNEFYVGSRTTGSGAGSFFLTGPTWTGTVPEGFAGAHQFETDLVVLIGRSQLLGEPDQEALAQIMKQYRLLSYEEFTGGSAPATPSFDWPHWDDEASRDERFIGYLNRLLPLCQPIHPSEEGLFERFGRIGIGPGIAFDATQLSSEHRSALATGVAAARKAMEETATNLGENINGWMSMSAFGDRDFYDGNYLQRAAESMVGWGGNDQIEAYYPMARTDGNGNALDGNARYRLRLPSEPPVNAFWSVTMYDTSYDGTAGYLVENPIGRYLISQITEGLVFDDGALSIVMQREAPDDANELANWLPTPDGPFYLALRLYWPKPDALDGTWVAPPVERIG